MMGDLIDRDKIYEAVYDLACKSASVIGGISEDYACGLREAAHMIEEAPAVDAVPMTHDLDSSDLIRRKDVLWITKETGAWETQNRVRELPAVAAVPLEYHDKCMEAAIKKRILTEQTNRQIIENYAPVVHGRWIGESDGYADGELVYDVWNCSKCDYCIDDGTDNPELLPNYCPNCGAKMRSDNDQ